MSQYGLTLPKPWSSKEKARVSRGRPHSYRGSSLEDGVVSRKVKQRTRDNTICKAHRKGKPRKKGPPPARRRKSGEAKGRPSHIGRADLRGDLLQHVVRNTRNMQIRISNCKPLSVSQRSKFENWFSHAVSTILDAENQ